MHTSAVRHDRDDRAASARALRSRQTEAEHELFDIGLATIGLQVVPCMLLGRATGAGAEPAPDSPSSRGDGWLLGKSSAFLHLGFIGAGLFAAGLLQVLALGGRMWIAVALMTGGAVLAVTSWRSARALLADAYPADESARSGERATGGARDQAFRVDRVHWHGAE